MGSSAQQEGSEIKSNRLDPVVSGSILCFGHVTISMLDRKLSPPSQTRHFLLLIRHWQPVYEECVCVCVSGLVHSPTTSVFPAVWSSQPLPSHLPPHPIPSNLPLSCCDGLGSVTHLPSWFLSMTSNCFLSHLQRHTKDDKATNQLTFMNFRNFLRFV